jgi:hypothetical protein
LRNEAKKPAELPEVPPHGSEEDFEFVTQHAMEIVAAESMLGLQMADDGFDPRTLRQQFPHASMFSGSFGCLSQGRRRDHARPIFGQGRDQLGAAYPSGEPAFSLADLTMMEECPPASLKS